MPEQTYENDDYIATSWGQHANAPAYHDLTVPSGQRCLVRRPGVEGLLKAGVLHNLDALTSLVDQKHVRRAEGRPPVDVDKIMNDQQSLENILRVTDKVVAYVVVKPAVELAPDSVTNRVPGTIYTDMVDLEDKMFILNYAVGGSADLEQFRRDADELMGTVDDVQGDALQAE